MSNESPFESIAKAMTGVTPKFDIASIQDALNPIQNNMKAWGDLAQAQTRATLSSINEAVESFKSVKKPEEAIELMKESAEHAMAMATKNLKDVTTLGVEQFKSTVSILENSNQVPPAFASVTQSMKEAASNMEHAFDSAMTGSGAAVADATHKVARKKTHA